MRDPYSITTIPNVGVVIITGGGVIERRPRAATRKRESGASLERVHKREEGELRGVENGNQGLEDPGPTRRVRGEGLDELPDLGAKPAVDGEDDRKEGDREETGEIGIFPNLGEFSRRQIRAWVERWLVDLTLGEHIYNRDVQSKALGGGDDKEVGALGVIRIRRIGKVRLGDVDETLR